MKRFPPGFSEQCFTTSKVILGVTLCLSPSAGSAETPPVETLDPVVVTATALPTNQSQTPIQTQVFKRMDFDLQQPNRLGTLLQQTPGVFVDEMGGRSGLSSLYIRGSDPNYTMVLLDGVPLNDPMNQRGGSVDLSSLTPERIERIEIVKGPASVFYGSDAMAGAVNIITQKGGIKDRLVARTEGGQWGYARGVLQASGAAGRFRYAGSAAFTRGRRTSQKEPVRIRNDRRPRELVAPGFDQARTDGTIHPHRHPFISRRQRRPAPGHSPFDGAADARTKSLPVST